MIEQDYIIRAINLFITRLLVVLGLKKEEPDRALEEIDHLYKQLFGLSSRIINLTPYSELLENNASDWGPDKILIIANLLKEEANIYKLKLEEERYVKAYIKSLNLFLEVLGSGHKTRLPKQYTEFGDILEALAEYKLPAPTSFRLINYYKQIGDFSKAEDVLYELSSNELQDGNIITWGIAFYEGLLEETDARLVKGNLPRDEVQEGLRQYKAKQRQ